MPILYSFRCYVQHSIALRVVAQKSATVKDNATYTTIPHKYKKTHLHPIKKYAERITSPCNPFTPALVLSNSRTQKRVMRLKPKCRVHGRGSARKGPLGGASASRGPQSGGKESIKCAKVLRSARNTVRMPAPGRYGAAWCGSWRIVSA